MKNFRLIIMTLAFAALLSSSCGSETAATQSPKEVIAIVEPTQPPAVIQKVEKVVEVETVEEVVEAEGETGSEVEEESQEEEQQEWTLTLKHIQGVNEKGKAVLAARVDPTVQIQSAHLLLGEKTIGNSKNFTAGDFELEFDQDDFNLENSINRLTLKVTDTNGFSHQVELLVSSTEKEIPVKTTFAAQVIGENLPLLPLPTIVMFNLHYLEMEWSIPAFGFIYVVPDKYKMVDAAYLSFDLPQVYAEQGYKPSISAQMNWGPAGPTGQPFGKTRGQYLNSTPYYFGAEPGWNWWFVPGRSKAYLDSAIFILNEPNTMSNVPGVFLPNGCTAVFPAQYTITQYTGSGEWDGTDANVFITLIGSLGESNEYSLDLSDYDDRKPGAVDIYKLEVKELIGDLQAVKIRHDNQGDGAGWFLKQITVRDPAYRKEAVFPCDQWLAKDEGDGKIERTLSR